MLFRGVEISELLKNPGDRLDLLIPNINYSLAFILEILPPDTKVRVVVSATTADLDALKQQVKYAFGDWQGVYQVYCVQLANGEALPLTEMILISTDIALTGSSIQALAENTEEFVPYIDGRIAAQKMFAELWEGKSNQYGSLKCSSIY